MKLFKVKATWFVRRDECFAVVVREGFPAAARLRASQQAFTPEEKLRWIREAEVTELSPEGEPESILAGHRG